MPGGSKKESAVWVYERGRDARPELVKDIGAEECFYSEPSTDGSKTLDEHIKDYENSFSIFLNNLKKGAIGEIVDPRHASEIVAHLTIRNAHFRRTFSFGIERIYNDAAALFSNKATLRPIMGVDDKQPSSRLMAAVDEHVNENPALASLGLPPRIFHHIAQMCLKEQFNRFFSEQIPTMISAIEGVADLAPYVVKKTHNKILTESAAPDNRIQFLRAMEWSVHQATDVSFVLPDCVALGMDEEALWKSFLLTNLSMVKVVLLPVSSTKMLVGIRTGEAIPDCSPSAPLRPFEGLHEGRISGSS